MTAISGQGVARGWPRAAPTAIRQAPCVGALQQASRLAVETAFTKFRKTYAAKDLEALVRMVEEGSYGSAACMALVKVGC